MTLHIDRLCAAYGQVRVLHEVSLHVDAGEVVALIGANGAGKTTLLHTVAGLHPPSSGAVGVDGEDVTGQPPHRLADRHVCLVPAGRELFADLSVSDNLAVGLHGTGADRAEGARRIEQVFALFPVLRDFAHREAGAMSGGQQQMLAIGRALVREPTVLLLDEPSLGLAPLVVTQILDTVAELARGGVAVLLAEQNATAALRIAHRGVVVENGRAVRTDDAATLLADEDVSRHYLGAMSGEATATTPRRMTIALDRLDA